MRRGSLLMLALMFLYAVACADTGASLRSGSPRPADNPGPTVTVVWPILQEVAPNPAAPGQSVHVIGSGGYHIMPDGGYDESSRPFALYLDGEPASNIICYVSRCEGDMLIPSETLSGTHSITTDGGSELSLHVVAPRVRAFLPLAQLDHESPCEREHADLSIACEPVIRVGDPLTMTLTLDNLGCLALGLPQYRLYVDPVGEASPFPALPEPVVHYLGVPPGRADSTTFVLHASRPGQVQIRGSVSYEIHLGYPGPAYWAGASSRTVNVRAVS